VPSGGSPFDAGSSSGAAAGSSLPELELLLLESSPGSLGGGSVGNGCCEAASEGVVVGLGESGGGAGLAGVPGKGNCSAVDFLAAGGGVQGLVVWSEVGAGVWFGAGQGVAGGFCGGVVCAKPATESAEAASSARIIG